MAPNDPSRQAKSANFMSEIEFLDLSDYEQYLQPYKGHRTQKECPNCNGKLDISRSNTELFSCYDGCSRSEVRKALLLLGGANQYQSQEFLDQQEARRSTRREAEIERIARLQTEDERNLDWMKIVSQLYLSDEHRQEMLNRGYPDELIDLSQARSSGRGRILPIVSATGKLVGSQIITPGGGKFWYGTSGTNQLRETNELPLQVVQPPNPQSNIIAYTESAIDKPFLSAHRWGMVTIGSANVGSQPKDLVRSIATLKLKYGWDVVTHLLMPDGGAVVNVGVIANYTRLNSQIEAMGGRLMVRWWGQLAKGGTDPDEIAIDVEYKDITFAEFLAIARSAQGLPPEKVKRKIPDPSPKKLPETEAEILADKLKQEAEAEARKAQQKIDDRKHYELLTQLSVDKSHKNVFIRNEKFLDEIPLPAPGQFTFVSSPCGTGKTEQLKAMIAFWKRTNPTGRLPGKLIDVTHRNSLRDGHQNRLGISDYKVGNGMTDDALNNLDAVSIVLDSICKIIIEQVPPRSFLVFDEIEAQLAHVALAGTLGNRMAAVAHHLGKLIRHVLSTGGFVVGLEDNLTDISIEMMLNLANRQHQYDLIVNQHERFHWDVQMGSGEFGSFISSILYRLGRGERLIIPTSARIFGEAMELLAIKEIPSLAGRTLRVDVKTVPELDPFLQDPNKFLADNDVRLCFLSPIVESGLSIDDGFFDRRIVYFVNLETRQHIQLLHRVRSNIPTDIYIKPRGADANSSSRNYKSLLKIRKQIAQQTSLLLGDGGNLAADSPEAEREGLLWNEYAAMIGARAQLAANYSAEYLELDLLARGHNVSHADWADCSLREFLAAGVAGRKTYATKSVQEQYKIFCDRIKREENSILYLADGMAITPATARMILASSGQTFEKRQQALKCLLHERWPNMHFSEEFLMACVTQDRGSYGRRVEFFWLLDKPELARDLDARQFKLQKSARFIRYDHVGKNTQIVNLFAPILHHLKDLAGGREYDKFDEAVVSIKEYAIGKADDLKRLMGMSIKPETIDSNGRARNTAIDTVNKFLKCVGFCPKVARKEGGKGDQLRIYQVTNSDCPHRQDIEDALKRKHREFLESLVNPVVTDSKVDILLESVTTDYADSRLDGIKVGDFIVHQGLKVQITYIDKGTYIGWDENGNVFGKKLA